MSATNEGEWSNGLNSFRQVTEVKLGRVGSNSEWVTSGARPHNATRRPSQGDVKLGVPCLMRHAKWAYISFQGLEILTSPLKKNRKKKTIDKSLERHLSISLNIPGHPKVSHECKKWHNTETCQEYGHMT